MFSFCYYLDMIKPTLIAVPLFALFIALEAWLSARANMQSYEKKDAWTNIGLGFFSLIVGGALGIISFTMYDFASQFAAFNIAMNTWWHWALIMLADDFAYYWFHRTSHESRFFWNMHVVHHSSNRYNLSVAVRQSWFSNISSWIFYLPLALVGFPYWAFVAAHGLNLIYQFWIHTEFVKKMGPLEWVLNTPSQHRVHHAINPDYLDKNYGGILCIWDRLFGTYKEEDAKNNKPKYGTITPLNSYNMLWINTHGWVEMWQGIKKAKTFSDKLKCIYASPYMKHITTENQNK